MVRVMTPSMDKYPVLQLVRATLMLRCKVVVIYRVALNKQRATKATLTLLPTKHL